MADISFYKYLEEAFKFKLRNPKGKNATLNTKFNYPGYSYNFTYDRIFHYARKVLPSFYTNKFSNNEEGNWQMAETILENLEKHRDKTLEDQFKGINPSKENQLTLKDAVDEATAEQTPSQNPAGEPVGAAAGGGSHASSHPPTMPHPPSMSSSSHPQGARINQPPGIGPATDKAARLAQQASAPKTEVPKAFEQAFKGEPLYKTDPTKNIAKNLGSSAGISFKKGSGAVARGLGDMAKGLGRGIVGPGLTSTYNLLGKAGSGSINAFSALSGQISRGGGIFGGGFFGKNTGRRVVIVFLGLFLVFGLVAGLLGGLSGGATPGGNTGIGTATPSAELTPITPPVTPTGPIPTEKLAQILHWGGIISRSLQYNSGYDVWDIMQADISNNGYTVTKQPGFPNSKYWCTYLVADSYNLSGIRGPNFITHGLVRNMLSFWQNTPGYFYMPYGVGTLRQVKPGYVVFRINAGSYTLDHASILSYIDVDERGNGEIRTLDSNTYNSWESRIINGQVQDRKFFALIVGFGGITE